MAGPLAFISYSHRYRDWVDALCRNLGRYLEAAGESREVCLDRADLKSGRSWVAQLQEGLRQAEHLVLVVTPEARSIRLRSSRSIFRRSHSRPTRVPWGLLLG